MISLFKLLIFGLGTLATPLEKRAAAVKIANGTVIGGTNGNVEFFKGIPFAEPPVGDLRFRHPKPFDSNFRELDATQRPPACIQGDGTTGSEDCLKLIVIRPTNRPSDKLPVLVFIHGGAFAGGEAEQGNDGTPVVKKSIELGKPFILVSIQYRLGAFGFLPGKQLAGNTNLGLRDQRLALQWVHDNIAAFGGDPDKVTLWGFSAGAMSAFDHTIINNGNINGLFRGIILSSGSMIPALSYDSPKAQEVYDTVASRAGCGQSSNSLECLRKVDAKKLQAAGYSLNMEFRYLGGNTPYFPRPDSSDSFYSTSADVAVATGKYGKVPVLSGNVEDEGTLFALTQSNVTNNKILVNYLSTYYPGNAQYTSQLVAKYPDDLGISGSPFGTGLQNNAFGQYKRLAAILGDITFVFQRRHHLQAIASEVPCWSYLNSGLFGLGVVGTMHGGDGMQALSSSNSVVAQTQQRYAIAFINTLDPNGLGISSPLINWPKYTASGAQLVHQKASSNALIKDDFRSEQYSYWSENISKFRI
ncbi:Carboxylic ester hydrolase [Fusarium falciforme]|uniref:Carboxylic ester hydrolase n=1 Tax=Fusarium falciforme TaxID=195108 RepID=UPI002300E495|nr:Carboxylic ester hydrolase [Fusarium falciforme]WAO96896.1 Carboxylic ester hydrolase [Fusarium falciforme]